MRLKLIIGCLLFFASILKLYSNSDTLNINTDFKEISIQAHGKVFLTKDLNMDIEKIIRLPESSFQPLEQTGNSFSPSNNVFWFKTIIQNDSDTLQQLMLEIRNPFLNYIQFFEIRNGQMNTSIAMGDDFLFKQRIIEHPSYLYPIHLKKGETIELYIYMKKLNESMMIKGSVWNSADFQTYDQRKNFSFSLFIGFLMCISFFTILVAAITRRKLLFYFSLYVIACLLCILLALGYGFMYIWSNIPHINDLGYLFLQVYFFSLIALTRSYLNSKKNAPTLDKLLWSAQFLSVIFIPATIFNQYMPSLLKTTLTNASHILYLMVLTVIISTVITVFRKGKNYWALLFLFGFLFGMIAISLFAIEYQGWVNNYWSAVITMICVVIDFSIMMIVIGNQIRLAFIKNIELQQELSQSQLAAASTLLEGQRLERQRLSQELHDGISIKLGLLRLKLSKVLKEKPEGNSIIQTFGNIMNEIRNFTHAISPFDTQTQTLLEAIETLIYDVEEQTSIQVHLNTMDFKEEKLENKERHAIFQTLKELFNNTIKHAKASEVEILLKNNDANCFLSFKDNGKGFELQSKKIGIGLRSIESRAKLFNGHFHIKSNEKGSFFQFVYPIS